MKQVLSRYGFMVFLLVTIVHLAAIGFGLEIPRIITKLLLMPILALTVFSAARGRYRKLIVFALFFSFLGDLFLLFEKQDPLYFIAGLVAFLITHILYISFFLRLKRPLEGLKNAWIMTVPLVLLYGIVLVYLLYPSLGGLKIPVMIYAFVICCMLISAINCFSVVKRKAGWMFVMGALLFVISDSLLAINKFYHPFSAASVLIMLSYCAAQYFIARGYIAYARSRTYA